MADTTVDASRSPDRRPDDEPRAARRIGEFVLLRLLGRGGMGEVWEAEQPSMHRRVALKLLRLGTFVNADMARRFEREAWIGGRLSHPCVVKVFEQGAVPDCLFIAMELVEGGSLHARLVSDRSGSTVPPKGDSAARRDRTRNVVRLFEGVADALAHVHAQGVVHRDVKPHNLLLTADGARLLLTDFGVAREGDASRLTQMGDLVGTLRYMSPEQLLANRASVDHRTDVWSLGVTLYEALTLSLPHDAQTDEGLVSAIAQQDPIPARRRSQDVPRDLETVLGKCLERDPARRYATAADVRDDLRRWLDDEPVLARRAGPFRRAARLARRHGRPLAAAMLAAVVVGSLAGVLAREARKTRDAEAARAVLEQVIRTGVLPDGRGSRWPALESRVRELVSAEPGGELAMLLARASATPRVTLERGVGLVAAPPSLRIDASALLGAHADLAHAVVVEGSLDGGPWSEITSALHRPARHGRERVSQVDLARIRAFQPLRALPHRLSLRARLLVLPAHAVNFAGLAESRSTFYGRGLVEPLWPRLSAVSLSEEERSLGTLSFALYETWPDDHPRRVALASLRQPPGTWFDVHTVTLAAERVPSDGRRALRVTLEPGADSSAPSMRVTIADSVAPGSLVLVGVALHGALDHARADASLAGRAHLRDADGREACAFDLVFGRVEAATTSGETRVQSVPVEAIGTPGQALASRAGSMVGVFAEADQALPDEMAGMATLTIVPDMEIARRHGCDPIVGEPVSFPVRVVLAAGGGPLSVRLAATEAPR